MVNLSKLPPRNKYGPGGLKNKGSMMQEHLAKQELALQLKREKKVQKYNKKWKAELTAREEEKKKLLEETKGQRAADRQKRREDRKKRHEQLIKHNEERIKEREDNLKKEVEEYKQREKEERQKNKGKRDKWKEEHEEFLEQQQEKLQKEMEAIVKERVERLEKSLRHVLSLASVQGRDFIIQVISRGTDFDDRELVRMFTQELNQEHLLVEELGPARKNGQILSYFHFADDLTQKYLYEDLGESEKVYHHEDIACALEEIFKELEFRTLAKVLH